jgi:hypothetical protein
MLFSTLGYVLVQGMCPKNMFGHSLNKIMMVLITVTKVVVFGKDVRTSLKVVRDRLIVG